jgi:putative ABC transport system substrate-binding protein
MRRRDFITLLGGAAAAWPFVARAQKAAVPVIGYLGGTAETDVSRLRAFRQGLGEAGFAEGRNVRIDYRGLGLPTDGRALELAAADLIRQQVSVVIAGAPTAARLKALTSTIPIVFLAEADPVQVGLVASLNRPGGNATGVNTMGSEIGGKQLSLMHELLPSAVRYAVLNGSTGFPAPLEEMQSAADGLGVQIEFIGVATVGEIDSAFASLGQKRTGALSVSSHPFLSDRRVQIATLATRYAIPTIYSNREPVDVGGLMSYGASQTDIRRQMGVYAGRILKGEKPANLPVLRPTKFELVINLSTARALGLNMPATLLAIADQVIE